MGSKDLLDEITDHIISNIPTSKLWATTVSLAAMAPFVSGVEFKLRTYGFVRSNWFALAVGPSGISNKSLPNNIIIRPIYHKVEEILKANSTVNQPDFVMPAGPSEAIISWLEKTSNHGLIIDDEFTSLLKASVSKDYMSDYMEFLTKLSDGYGMRRFTYKHGIQNINEVNVSMISTTTPYMYKVISRDTFLQGVSNRFVYTVFRDDDMQEVQSKYNDETADNFFILERVQNPVYNKDNDIAAKIADLYLALQDSWIAVPTAAAARMLLEYRWKKKRQAASMFHDTGVGDYEYSYIDRLPEKLFKVVIVLGLNL